MASSNRDKTTGTGMSYHLDPLSAKPLYEQFADQVATRIGRGEYEAGKPLPAIKSLETMVNASRITVVRALKELTARGLVTPRGTRGYFVNPPRNPVYVGFVVPLHTVFMSIYGKMHAALQLAVRRRYGTLVVASSEEEPRVFRERVTEMVFGMGVRKLALVPPCVERGRDKVHPEAVDFLHELGRVPDLSIACMDRALAPEGFTVLRQNRESGYSQALCFLAGRGYRNVLALNPTPQIESAYTRVRPHLGGTKVTWLQLGRLSQQEIMEQALLHAADAVLVDDLAAALLLEHFGSVPFGLMGYNGSDFVDVCPVRLTSVDSNLRVMGRAAFQALEAGHAGVEILIEPCVRPGDTTPGPGQRPAPGNGLDLGPDARVCAPGKQSPEPPAATPAGKK